MARPKVKVRKVEVSLKFLSARAVFEIVEEVRRTGLSEEFLKQCDERQSGVVISKEDANFVKKFLADYANEPRDGEQGSDEDRELLAMIVRTAGSRPRC